MKANSEGIKKVQSKQRGLFMSVITLIGARVKVMYFLIKKQ